MTTNVIEIERTYAYQKQEKFMCEKIKINPHINLERFHEICDDAYINSLCESVCNSTK